MFPRQRALCLRPSRRRALVAIPSDGEEESAESQRANACAFICLVLCLLCRVLPSLRTSFLAFTQFGFQEELLQYQWRHRRLSAHCLTLKVSHFLNFLSAGMVGLFSHQNIRPLCHLHNYGVQKSCQNRRQEKRTYNLNFQLACLSFSVLFPFFQTNLMFMTWRIP